MTSLGDCNLPNHETSLQKKVFFAKELNNFTKNIQVAPNCLNQNAINARLSLQS